MYTQMHTFISTSIHSSTHPHTRSSTHTCIHTHVHPHIHTYTHTHKHTCTTERHPRVRTSAAPFLGCWHWCLGEVAQAHATAECAPPARTLSLLHCGPVCHWKSHASWRPSHPLSLSLCVCVSVCLLRCCTCVCACSRVKRLAGPVVGDPHAVSSPVGGGMPVRVAHTSTHPLTHHIRPHRGTLPQSEGHPPPATEGRRQQPMKESYIGTIYCGGGCMGIL